jgi:hypothetical protein
VPDASLNCSTPTTDANGDSQYCCGTTTAACAADSTVDCSASGTTGYSCPSGVVPDASAGTCSTPTTTANGDTYCCGTSTGTTCTADSTVQGCTGSSTGYSCTGTDTPDQSASLTCSIGVAGSGDTLYCCSDVNAPAGCMVDDTVTGCTGGSYGFSCTGTDAPDANDPTLSCSDGVAGSGDTLYCCSDVNTPATCMADDSVTGCTGNSYGFSCTGTDAPDANDTSLICSEGVAGTGDTLYCCIDNTATTCTQDDTLTCPTPGSFGFTCTGSDDPSTSDTTLTCSNPTTDADGNMDYCCTN